MVKILTVLGTRPEAIKLGPVILQLRSRRSQFEVKVCATAQHRSMLDQVLGLFGVTPDHDLNLMQPGQTLSGSMSRMLAALEPVLQRENPEMVLVQGDTMTTLCGAMAAFHQRIPVGHVEAGLRTGDFRQPFPEEMNRVLTAPLTALHFAATERAQLNLLAERIPRERILVTGNSGIDAVLHVQRGLERGILRGNEWPQLDSRKKLILVTAHRRESFGAGFEQICRALAALAEREDVQIVWPVHPNPNVTATVHMLLEERRNIFLLEPLEYVAFVDLMRRARILITDSGGVQEEGPSLGKPILVMREKTERPEAVEAGTVRLVGTDEQRIVEEATLLLDDEREYRGRSRVHNPYGDGRAGGRIADAIHSFFAQKRLPKPLKYSTHAG